MRQTIILWLVALTPLVSIAQNCGLEDTLLINSNSTHVFTLELDGYFNDDLADDQQGVCGVEVEFVHAFSENLEMWLVSPNGDSVQLIGPNTNDNSAFTFAALWDITFVPCSAAAEPDSGYVAQWDNNQANNFVAGGQYRGSYYPFGGCLEDFATGPVNGSWTIAINNDPSFYPGGLIDFRIVFCDPRGVECCFSEPGIFPDSLDRIACAGDPVLQLDSLAPAYPFYLTQPDSIEYGYTYAIGEDNILLAYDSLVDLSAFPPGNYEVCGLSYKRSDQDSLWLPDGMLTIDSIRNNLSSELPRFCGGLADNCVEITITPVPDTTFLDPVICTGDSLSVADTILFAGGVYTFTFPSTGGCDSIVVVDLTVEATAFIALEEVICEGSTFPVGDSLYAGEGIYIDTLLTVNGCDSIVELELTVVAPDTVELNETICEGEAFVVGGTPFFNAGFHQLTLQSSLGCDSVVNLNLNVLAPVAAALPSDTLSCFQPEVVLDGSVSSGGAGLSFQWYDPGGAPIGQTDTLSVGEAGDYQLVVGLEENGVVCRDTAVAPVIADQAPPVADAGLPDTLNCVDTLVGLGGPATSSGPDFSYAWSTAGGELAGPADTPLNGALADGLYTLIVTDQRNGCSDTASVAIAVDTLPPAVVVAPPSPLDCVTPAVVLDGSGSSTGAEFIYNWTAITGTPPQDADSLLATAAQPGAYRLQVTNTRNSCVDSATVSVAIDTLPPVVNIASPDTLNCAQTNTLLSASVSGAGGNFDLLWRTGAGGNIVSGADSLSPLVDQPGSYELVVINAENGCRDSSEVTVTELVSTVLADAGPDTVLTCTVDTVLLGGPGTTTGPAMQYQWSLAGGMLLPGGNDPVLSVAAPGVYQLIATDSLTRCADTSAVAVAVDTLSPSADAGPGLTLDCTTTRDTLDGSLSSAGPDFSYEWNGPCLISDPNAIRVVVDCPGEYVLTVRNQMNGCERADSVTVAQDAAAPTAIIAPPDTLTCQNDTIILDGAASSQGPNLISHWAGPGNFDVSGALSASVAAPGIYTLIVTDTLNTCADTTSATVVQDTLPPVADAGLPGTLTCLTPELTIGGAAADPNATYAWTTSGGRITGPLDSLQTQADSAGWYTLVVTNILNGCTATDSVLITADQSPPSVDAGPDQTISCEQPVVTLDGGGSDSGPAIVYTWTGPCILGPADSPSIQADCPGLYALLVQNTDNGCTATDTVLVMRDEAPPTAEAGPGDTLTCVVASLTLDGAGSSQGSGFSYSWSGPSVVSGQESLLPVVNAPGVYYLSVTDLVNGCTAVDSVAVAENTVAPVADAGPMQAINCLADTVTLGGVLTSTGPGISYQWLSNEGNPLAPVDEATVQADAPGVYVLFVTDTDNGCADTNFVNVVVDTLPPVVNVDAPDLITCSESEVWVDGSDAPAGPGFTYEWSGPCLLTEPDSNFVLVECPGVYQLEVTNLDNGCRGADSTQVLLAPETPLAILPDTTFLSCDTGLVTLDGSASTNGPNDWQFNGQPIALNQLSPVVDQPGSYQLVVTNLVQSCFDTATTVVVLDCQPQIELFVTDTITCAQPTLELAPAVLPAGVDYEFQWTADNPGCILGPNNENTLTVSCGGSFTVIVTNPLFGLSDTTTVAVAENRNFPTADAGASDTLTCTTPAVTIGGIGSSAGPEIAYLWTNFSGDTLGSTPTITVDTPDTYFLEVINTVNGCAVGDFVVVSEIVGLPDVLFGSTQFPCTQDTFRLQAFLDPPGSFYEFTWTGPGILDGGDSLSVWIDTAGLYTLTVVNPFIDCASTDTVLVTEQECGPCLSIAPPDTLSCAVTEITLQAEYCEPCPGCTFSWSTEGGALLPGTDTTFSPVATLPGIYTLSAVDTFGVASEFSVTVVAAVDPPTVNAGPDRTLTCGQPAATIGPINDEPLADHSYSWTSFAGASIDPADQITGTVTEADTFVLEVVNDLTGCVGRDTVVVGTDTIPPVADAGPDLALTCVVGLVSPDGSGSSLGAGFTYQWATDGDGEIVGASTLNPVVDAAGHYWLSVTDAANQCTAADTMAVVSETTAPALPSIPDTAITCQDTSLLLPGSLPDDTGFSFEWCRLDAEDNPVDCQSETLLWAVAEPGDYQFTVTDDTTGCTSSLIVTIDLDATPPIAEAGGNDTLFCNLTSLSLAGAAGPDTADLQISWSSLNGSPIENGETLTPLIFEPDVYYLAVTNSENQCTSIDSVLIARDQDAPEADAGADTTLSCTIREIRLSGSGNTVSGAISYLWRTIDGRILADSTMATPLVDQPGTYWLSVTDPVNDCVVADTVFVAADTLSPQALLADTSGLLLTCRDSILVLDGSSSAGSSPELSYQWLAPAGGEIIGATDSVEAVVGRPGDYRLVVQNSGNGCRDTLLIHIEGDFNAPVATIGTTPALTCRDTAVLLDGSQSTGGPDLLVQWLDAAGAQIPASGLQATVAEPGAYRLLLVDTVNGCSDSTEVTVPIDTVPPVAVLAPPADLDCDVPQVTLDGAASSAGPDIQYEWYREGELLEAEEQPTLVVEAPGNYALVTTDQSNGCVDSAGVVVRERSIPIDGANLTVIAPSCTGLTLGSVAIDSVFGGTAPFVFGIDEAPMTVQGAFPNLQTGSYPLVIQDAKGCEWDTLVAVPEPPLLQLSLGADTTIFLGDSLVLVAEMNADTSAAVRWTATGLPAGQGSSLPVQPLETTTYGATVTDEEGCTATDWITVFVIRPDRVFIPSAFSPNGDGQNDRLTIFAGTDVSRIVSWSIFDRWGNQVFSATDFPPNDPASGWDGTFQGKPMNAAVFVYRAAIEYADGKTEGLHGDVLLVR